MAVDRGNAHVQCHLVECHLRGFGVPENPVKGVQLIRASAAEGNTIAIEMLHENRLELEEEEKNEVTTKSGPVIDIFRNSASRARNLYSKTVEQQSQEKADIIQHNSEKTKRLNVLMSSDD